MTLWQIVGFLGWAYISLLTYIGVEWAVDIYPYFAWFISLYMFIIGLILVLGFSVSNDTEILREFIDKQTVLVWVTALPLWTVNLYLLNLTECFTQLYLYGFGAIFILCSVAIAYIKQLY